MENDVEQYVKSCLVCQQEKTKRRKEVGLLEPLPIPERPSASLSMDFIVNLSNVDGFISIILVVDQFSKYVTFISASHAVSTNQTAGLFFKNVVKLWGIPLDIVSDRAARFTRNFRMALFEYIGTQLKLSTSNHPQTDGQIERINSMLEEHLRHYVTAN